MGWGPERHPISELCWAVFDLVLEEMQSFSTLYFRGLFLKAYSLTRTALLRLGLPLVIWWQ